jgi:hypothetical protein
MRRSLVLLPIAALLASAAPAGASPAQLRTALEAARAPVAQLDRSASRASLGARFYRYRHELRGLPVLGAEVVVTDAPGAHGDLVVDASRRLAPPPPATIGRRAAERAALSRVGRGRVLRAGLAVLPEAGAGSRAVWRVVVDATAPPGAWEVLVDARSGAIVRVRDLLQHATGIAALFDPQPDRHERRPRHGRRRRCGPADDPQRGQHRLQALIEASGYRVARSHTARVRVRR